MSKKAVISVGLVVLAALVIGLFAFDTAFAKEGGLINRIKRANGSLGQVSEIKKNEFSVTRRDGSKVTYLTDEKTRFIDRDRNELTFSDLVDGGWAWVAAPDMQGEKPTARVVVILPEDFNPEEIVGSRGTIAGVNISASEFTLKTKDDQEVTFDVNEQTRFRGQADDLSGLAEGMWARVLGEKQTDGSILALGIGSSYPQARTLGQITVVNQAEGTFTLKRRDGSEVTYGVNEETRFRSKDQSVADLSDLKEGMLGAVIAVDDPEYGSPLAKLVLVADRQGLPKTDARFAGKVTAVGDNSITIQTRGGEAITFQVTGSTKFRSRAGRINSLDDLKEGMLVLVGAKELGSGEYQAEIVIAGRGR